MYICRWPMCGRISTEEDTEVPFCPKHRRAYAEWKEAYKEAVFGATGKSDPKTLVEGISADLAEIPGNSIKIKF
jgi:hypothetical protein